MNCKKCGAELHDDQKVCIQCGTLTVAGGGFDYGNKDPWRPTKKMIYGAGAVVALLIIALIINGMRVVPPDVVANEWFDAMSQRRIKAAKEYMAPELVEKMSVNLGMEATADEYFTMITTEGGKCKIEKPRMSGTTSAEVTLDISKPDGEQEVRLVMSKVGRKWLINQVN